MGIVVYRNQLRKMYPLFCLENAGFSELCGVFGRRMKKDPLNMQKKGGFFDGKTL